MSKLAVIDIGTNSAKVTVIESVGGALGPVLLDATQITRLGEGVGASKTLIPPAMLRTADVVSGFVEQARSIGAQEIRIVGTSALRDASNRAEFIDLVRGKAGIAPEVIGGEREAALAYAAVRADPAIASRLRGELLVFDIGGGSTELIVGEGLSPQKKISLDMGAVRLTERFMRSDPPAPQEIEEAARSIAESLAGTDWAGKPSMAAGIGGTVVTIAAVVQVCDPPDPEKLNGVDLSTADVDGAIDRFIVSSLDERRAIPGLDPKRADVIIAGSLILASLLKAFNLKSLTVSTRGLRFGLLAEMAAEDQEGN